MWPSVWYASVIHCHRPLYGIIRSVKVVDRLPSGTSALSRTSLHSSKALPSIGGCLDGGGQLGAVQNQSPALSERNEGSSRLRGPVLVISFNVLASLLGLLHGK